MRVPSSCVPLMQIDEVFSGYGIWPHQDVVYLGPVEKLVFAIELPFPGQDRAACVQGEPPQSEGTDTSDGLLSSKARNHLLPTISCYFRLSSSCCVMTLFSLI